MELHILDLARNLVGPIADAESVAATERLVFPPNFEPQIAVGTGDGAVLTAKDGGLTRWQL